MQLATTPAAALVLFRLTHASPPLICIDPGHPSESGRGTHGRHSTEIQVAYKIATRLRTRLTHDGYRVVLTKRSLSQFVTNSRRAQIANAAHAALLLRLHCDASTGSGFTVYFPTEPGRAGKAVGPSDAVLGSSSIAAEALYAAMRNSLRTTLAALGLKSDTKTAIGARQGALTGSIYSRVPTVLVEMVVLTNPKDEDWILSKAGEGAMVRALEMGVEAAAPLPRSR